VTASLGTAFYGKGTMAPGWYLYVFPVPPSVGIHKIRAPVLYGYSGGACIIIRLLLLALSVSISTSGENWMRPTIG